MSVQPVPVVVWDHRVNRDHKEQRALLDNKESLGRRVLVEPKALQDPKVIQLWDHKALWVLKDPLDHRGPRVRKVHREIQS